MESWEGHNYYTRNNTKWVQLMNLSTAEWNVGWFPANVIAIPGKLNDSWDIPPDAFVIENASREDLGDRNVEAVIFGLTSAFALVWAVGWLFWSIRDKSLSRPRSETKKSQNVQNSSSSQQTSITHVKGRTPEDDGPLHAQIFEHRLRLYYPTTATEAELYEKDVRAELHAKDAEAVSDLLRRMFEKDLELLAIQNGSKVSDLDMDKLRLESDAILAEVHRIVGTWHTRGMNTREMRELQEIRNILPRIRVPRYMHPGYAQQFSQNGGVVP